MVSAPHEAMHRIFQDHPDLFSGVAEALGVEFPAATSLTVMPTDLTETDPVERRIDTLLRVDTEYGEPLLLAIEAQGKKVPEKLATWAYYVSYLLTKYQMQPMLLVVCQDRVTAEWAAQPVTFGPPQWPLLTLRPLVAGPHNMPWITDPAEARKNLALTTLSVITHAKNRNVGAIMKAVTTVLRDTPEAERISVVELISQGLGKLPAAKLWRNLMAVDLSFFKSPIMREVLAETQAKGEAEGRAEGQAKGRAEGRAEDILFILSRRGLDVPDQARERITTCTDLDTLRLWLDRALTATTVEGLFADE